MGKKKHVVIRISEEGFVDVYGTYTQEEADQLVEYLYSIDTSQKDHIGSEKLSRYKEIEQ